MHLRTGGEITSLFNLREYLTTALRGATAVTLQDRGRTLALLSLATASGNTDVAGFDAAKAKLAAPRDIVISLAADGRLALRVDEHTIEVPADARGAEAIRRLLEARAHDNRPQVGKPSSPHQAMIDVWLRDNEVTRDKPVLDLEGIEI